ncbi:MAG: NfeD family protein [Candidatus Hydrogenedentes bacterium]|nr:NfeD family protein [Candidatus Hydrogenedentota bacterium]
MAQWIDVLLVVVGIILILVEVFVFPGVAVVGGLGLVCLLLGVYLSLTGVAVPTYSWDYDRLRDAGFTLTIAATTFALLVYAVWKLFPHTPLYGRLVQQHVEASSAGYVVQTADKQMAVGMKGVAVSMLRPSGRGRFDKAAYQVVTRGDFISPGAPIVIVQVDGNRYVVEQSEEVS